MLAGLSAGLLSSPAQAATKAAPKVSVSAPKASPGDYEGSCPTKINFAAQIKVPVKGKTELAYRWLHGDGSKGKVNVIKLKGHGTKTVTVKQAITFKEDVKGWEAVQVLGPKKVTSKRGYFSVSCQEAQEVDRTQLDPTVTARAWASPSSYAGRCDTYGDKIDFTGLIKVDRPSWVRYRWVLNGDVVDYGKIKVRDARKVGFGINPRHSQRGWAQLEVLSPDATSSNRAYYKVWCKDERRDDHRDDHKSPESHDIKVSAAASVTNSASCALTSTGSITSTGPGKVRYQWSLNGTAVKSGEVTFDGKGTKSVDGLSATLTGAATKGGTVTFLVVGPDNSDVVTQSYSSCEAPAPAESASSSAA
ncbi:unnamed protein product [[Actinomadura] parvosata subsp. kistnae]|uniref:Ig-like domain-containing protein n=1 Tax=[Actinomadura] parvosata subsp. kistnae TaxID=1909395 RepID=A0A1V0AER3_9ACTN|nr:hypothetical protein BKM31_50990 [Nonomuraea sp. ATCC 55076]SPL92803.1 unnamed protein product [Actinomadura parvosata subsp. kistnae]